VTKRRKRRSKPSPIVRLRRYWLLGAVALTIALAGGWWLATAPVFRLEKLTVSGLAHVSRQEVLDQAALDPHANVWLMNRGAVQHRIESIPYVLRARVHRSFPARVWIEVTERAGDGCVRDAARETYTIDAALRVLAIGCPLSPRMTFVIRGILAAEPGTFLDDPELLRLQSDARALATTQDRYHAFAHDAFGELVATLARGIDVRFGDDNDLERKQRLIGPILAQLGPRASGVRAVDLRAPATPVVEYRH